MSEREWIGRHLTLHIAADARTRRTQYADDQTWEVSLGQGDQPAIALQTRYAGRVTLLRIVPMLKQSHQASVYQAQSFAGDIKVKAFGTDAMLLQAEPLPNVQLKMFFWAMESFTVGGTYTLLNNTSIPIEINFQLYAQAMRRREVVQMNMLELEVPGGTMSGLALGEIGNLHPALLLENGQPTAATKLFEPMTLTPGQPDGGRFVIASLPTLDASLDRAFAWLTDTDWGAHREEINTRQANLPIFDTGNDALDAAIAWSQRVALRSMLANAPKLPYPTAAFTRSPDFGFSPNGIDHPRPWNGQTALDTLLLAGALTTLEPDLAKGLLRNYLAVQEADGWIDAAPGGAGQRVGQILLPILAQLTEWIYGITQDDLFVKEVYAGLLRFYGRWFAGDIDIDADGFSEWRTIYQAQQEFHPIFSTFRANAQNVDIAMVEAPDLASYLLAEAEALERLADIAGQGQAWNKLAKHHTRLGDQLQQNWDAEHQRFQYRDRDTNALLIGETVFRGKGDEAMTQPVTLEMANRLVIRAKGGGKRPRHISATIEGVTADGKTITEVIPNAAFIAYRSLAVATSKNLWQQVNHIKLEGLSRIFDVEIDTVDLSRHDLTLLLPYITSTITSEQAQAILADLQGDYWQTYGLSRLPKSDPHYSNRADDYSGQHVVVPWVVLLGLALLQRGEYETSAALFDRLAAAQIKTLTEQGSFFQWYDAEEGHGLGQFDHATGIIPLYWFTQLIGVVIRDAGTVEVIGAFAYSQKIRVARFGVKVARNTEKTVVQFPSGLVKEFTEDKGVITDPNYKSVSKQHTIPDAPAFPEAKKKGRKRVPVTTPVIDDDDEPVWGAVD